jgi:ABC-type glycerol-3-phosphate transport system substrate-binding protein
VALGYFSNVVHAKDILTAMFMQTGNGIVTSKNGMLRSALGASGNYNLSSILQYYSSFADSTQPIYSWNKSFSNSLDAFSREDLAFYFGPSSELRSLVDRNPNQNLGVAPIPQLANATSKITSARVTGVAISSASKDLTTAFVVASKIATTDFAAKVASVLEIPPARRDLLLVKPSDAYGPTFYNSALYAKSYLDPSPKGTDDIFRTMIDTVLSNNATATNAITNASSRLDILLLK